MTMLSPCTDVGRTTQVRLRTAPDWLPERYQQRKERIRIKFRPTAGEKRLLRRKKPEPPSVWAPKNRVVTYGPLTGSRWDNSFMPHMRGIMDASFFPSVRYIGNCKSPQGGSSAGAETVIGYISDRCPGAALITYPDRDTAAKRSTDYLQPMFKLSPRLRKLLTGTSDDLASLRIKLQTMLIYMGWAGSLTSLGNVSCKYLVGDEVDKWPKQANKKEANTLKLFFERFRAFKYGAKCWLISTPSDPEGPIWQFLVNDAQVVFDYGVPCPECGQVHIVDFKYIKFGDERDPKKVEEQDLARYVFPCCGVEADDRLRIKALQQGRWFERLGDERRKKGEYGRELFVYLREEHPRKICFHSPGWISPLVGNSEIAAAFLRGLADPAEMHYFDNQIAAKAHVPYRQNRKTKAILALNDDRPEGLVPGGGQVCALIAGVDTQKHNFVYTIRAFGWGMTQESWLVRHGEVDTFAGLEEVLFEKQYQDVGGLYYPVHLAVIDTGGDKTSDVYDWCRMHPGRVLAYKGAVGRRNRPWSKTIIDHYPGTKVPIPGGLELYLCDTHYFKDQLAGKLRIKPDAPGAYHLHGETTEEFAQHMCAEFRDEKLLWRCPKNKPNHYWDCSVMELVGADVMKIKLLENDQTEEAA